MHCSRIEKRAKDAGTKSVGNFALDAMGECFIARKTRSASPFPPRISTAEGSTGLLLPPESSYINTCMVSLYSLGFSDA